MLYHGRHSAYIKSTYIIFLLFVVIFQTCRQYRAKASFLTLYWTSFLFFTNNKTVAFWKDIWFLNRLPFVFPSHVKPVIETCSTPRESGWISCSSTTMTAIIADLLEYYFLICCGYFSIFLQETGIQKWRCYLSCLSFFFPQADTPDQ